MVVDSKISFDVGNFLSLSLYSGVAFIVICLVAINYYYLSLILLKPVVEQKIPILYQCIFIVVASLLIFFISKNGFDINNFLTISIVIVLVFYIIIVQKIENIKEPINIISLTLPTFWILFFSAIASSLIVSYNNLIGS